jgi:hypothetical protein
MGMTCWVFGTLVYTTFFLLNLSCCFLKKKVRTSLVSFLINCLLWCHEWEIMILMDTLSVCPNYWPTISLPFPVLFFSHSTPRDEGITMSGEGEQIIEEARSPIEHFARIFRPKSPHMWWGWNTSRWIDAGADCSGPCRWSWVGGETWLLQECWSWWVAR